MPVGTTGAGRTAGKRNTTEMLLQEELQDLRSLLVQADHLRWVTRGEDATSFCSLVRRFSEEWRIWSEGVARCLIRLGVPPDGRVSSLTEGSYRAWLPGEWVDVREADEWMLRELGVLGDRRKKKGK